MRILLAGLLPLCFGAFALAQGPFVVSGVLPTIVGTAESAPNRSECGVGAIMAWADALYYVTYLSVPGAGNGTGLYKVTPNMEQTLVAEHSSVFANRLLIPGMNSIVIGPYIIDAVGGVRTIPSLLHVRIGGMAEHLLYPETKVYMLGMDGPLWEVDLVTLEAVQLFDMIKALDMCNFPITCPEQPHFKAAYTGGGKLWVATNTYEEQDELSIQHGGRLAWWDGTSSNWTIVQRTAFVEVTGRKDMGAVFFALGWGACVSKQKHSVPSGAIGVRPWPLFCPSQACLLLSKPRNPHPIHPTQTSHPQMMPQ